MLGLFKLKSLMNSTRKEIDLSRVINYVLLGGDQVTPNIEYFGVLFYEFNDSSFGKCVLDENYFNRTLKTLPKEREITIMDFIRKISSNWGIDLGIIKNFYFDNNKIKLSAPVDKDFNITIIGSYFPNVSLRPFDNKLLLETFYRGHTYISEYLIKNVDNKIQLKINEVKIYTLNTDDAFIIYNDSKFSESEWAKYEQFERESGLYKNVDHIKQETIEAIDRNCKDTPLCITTFIQCVYEGKNSNFLENMLNFHIKELENNTSKMIEFFEKRGTPFSEKTQELIANLEINKNDSKKAWEEMIDVLKQYFFI